MKSILIFILLTVNVHARTSDPYIIPELKNDLDTIENLANGKILMGNASGVSAEVTPSGDVTMTNAGVNAITAESIVETDFASITAEGLHPDRVAVFDYDFAVDGGGQAGGITTGVNLPAKAVIEKAYFRIETQLVDAGAGTLAVHCEDADNILTAADQTGVAAGAFLASNVTGTAANMVDDIAATCDITVSIAGASTTAGKFRGYIHYQVHP